MTKRTYLEIKTILIILFAVYVSFMIMDIFYSNLFIYSNYLKFIGIVLVGVLTFVERKHSISIKDINLLNLAMILTIISDYFLLFEGNNYIIGIGIFSLAHLIHGIRMEKNKTKVIFIRYISYLIITITLYSVFLDTPYEIDLIVFVSLFYFANLLSNLLRALDVYRHNKFPLINSSLLVAGFILFLLCDINVAIYNVVPLNTANIFLYILSDLSLRLMWFFYLPSQIFIALSGLDFEY
ncbi:hypothetical protein E4100_03225 [Soehngenia longivitae]|uniref:YhhN-like protein n=1 Tax=Soehngenia longivitae TaxID=2562294 RepID=A0A4Z0D886_9FIRM|nr:lysoplasmalogenase family protein [Soehngenia longivitae]TFZ41124.1 hypothetical protein E4100_03225 [Soehngenia longivitae]